MPKDGSTLAESIKIEAAFRVENELKLIEGGAKLITVKSGACSGEERNSPQFTNRAAIYFFTSPRLRGEVGSPWRSG
jgi:hypothetical protein